MNYEKEIRDLKRQVSELQQSVLQMGGNNMVRNEKLDTTANGLVVTDERVEVNTSNIDYLAMMTDVDIPTEV